MIDSQGCETARRSEGVLDRRCPVRQPPFDLGTLATALCVGIDDEWKASPQLNPCRPKVGITPRITDAELITVSVMQAPLGYHNESRPPLAAPAALAVRRARCPPPAPRNFLKVGVSAAKIHPGSWKTGPQHTRDTPTSMKLDRPHPNFQETGPKPAPTITGEAPAASGSPTTPTCGGTPIRIAGPTPVFCGMSREAARRCDLDTSSRSTKPSKNNSSALNDTAAAPSPASPCESCNAFSS